MDKVISIPDWVDERANIYIQAGMEPFMKREQGVWYIKIKRCNKCGKCCMNVPKNWPHGQGENGHCQHLTFDNEEFPCGLKANRPHMCCVGDGDIEDCCVEWKAETEA